MLPYKVTHFFSVSRGNFCHKRRFRAHKRKTDAPGRARFNDLPSPLPEAWTESGALCPLNQTGRRPRQSLEGRPCGSLRERRAGHPPPAPLQGLRPPRGHGSPPCRPPHAPPGIPPLPSRSLIGGSLAHLARANCGRVTCGVALQRGRTSSAGTPIPPASDRSGVSGPSAPPPPRAPPPRGRTVWQPCAAPPGMLGLRHMPRYTRGTDGHSIRFLCQGSPMWSHSGSPHVEPTRR